MNKLQNIENPGLVDLISSYRPSEEVVNLVRSTQIVLFCGITGAGKDTVKGELLKHDGFERIVTSTTREPRVNSGVMEQDGREYYFFSTEQAYENIMTKRYFEVALVHGRINGVTAAEIERHQRADIVAVGDVDYQGVDYFKKYAPSTLAIFLVPPTYDSWLERLKQRYDSEAEFQGEWPARRSSSVRELRWALDSGNCHIIVNDDLERTVDQARQLIGGGQAPENGSQAAQAILERLNSAT